MNCIRARSSRTCAACSWQPGHCRHVTSRWPRLERFLRDILATRTDPDQRQILHRYANWHLLRRLRRRNNGQPATHQQ
jgi:hypothetical protein